MKDIKAEIEVRREACEIGARRIYEDFFCLLVGKEKLRQFRFINSVGNCSRDYSCLENYSRAGAVIGIAMLEKGVLEYNLKYFGTPSDELCAFTKTLDKLLSNGKGN